MKNDTLIKKTFRSLLIKIAIWTISFPFLSSLFLLFIQFGDFQLVYDLSPSLYYLLRNIYVSIDNYLFLILLIIWFIGIIFLIYKILKKYNSFIRNLSDAASKLLDSKVDYISLPPELSEFEKKLNHLKNENERNERLAKENEQKKNDLIVYLAHDLKTPLTSMIGYLSLLDEIKDMPSNQREKYIKIALDKSYRLEDLINELFDIARFNTETIILEKKEISLNLMLEQIIDDFYPILTEERKQITLISPSKITITGDSDKLARVFNNLIKNAISYSTTKEITITTEVKDNYALITTSNKSKKIPYEKQKKIFDKFYRADASRTSKTGGSGLGLAIAKEIVELHGGTISLDSDDEFTKFIVKLPIDN